MSWLATLALVLGLPACSPSTPLTAPHQPAATNGGADHWQPQGTMGWHLQYDGAPVSPDVPVFNLDGVGATAQRIRELHDAGAHVICYINAGGSEDFRDDLASLPDGVRGNPLDDWPGERWFDVRELDVLLPIMAARMDTCVGKGFDAVDPDNLDGYAHDTGFPLTTADALAYQRALIGLAHERGLAIGLKNATALLPDLADEVDFAVNEQCQQYDECDAYQPLIALGKPVFNVEYGGSCNGQPAGISTLLANLSLDGPTTSCR